MTSGDSNLIFRKGELKDLDQLKQLVDQHKAELGFVIRGALLKSIESSELMVTVDDDCLVGFVHYRHRLDGQTTLYNIVVRKSNRGSGIGRRLIAALTNEAYKKGQQVIRLKCPSNLSANEFYRRNGFELSSVEEGKLKPLNVWSKELKNNPAK